MIFCIDFDGVICDSLAECYLSSAYALGLSIDLRNLMVDPIYRSFQKCRPFVRSGEDYIMIQHWLRQGRKLPADQKEFDSLRQESKSLLTQYKDQMYQARDELLSGRKNDWLEANPLYPGWKEVILTLIPQEQAHILSTKKSAYIGEILGFHGIEFPADRIHYATAKEKPLKMKRLQEKYGVQRVYLLDDQPDHLERLKDPGLYGILATWGYASPNAFYQPQWERSEALDYFIRRFPRLPESREN